MIRKSFKKLQNLLNFGHNIIIYPCLVYILILIVEAFNYIDPLLWRKYISIHHLVFPMISMLLYQQNVKSYYFIIILHILI